MAMIEGPVDISGPPEIDPVVVKLRGGFSPSRALREILLPGDWR